MLLPWPRRLLPRLTLAGAAGIVLSMLGLMAYILAIEYRASAAETEIRAHSLAEGMAAAISASAIVHDFASIEAQFQKLSVNEDLLLVALTDRQGRPHAGIIRSKPGAAVRPIGEAQLSHDPISHKNIMRGDRIEIWEPVDIGLYPMWVHLHLALPDDSERRNAILQSTLLAAILAALLGAGVLFLLLRRPVAAIAQAAGFAASLPHSVGAVLTLPTTTEELTRLADALNDASATLAEKQQALEQTRQHDALRSRVMEMLATNADLMYILDHLTHHVTVQGEGLSLRIQLTESSNGEPVPQGTSADWKQPITDAHGHGLGLLLATTATGQPPTATQCERLAHVAQLAALAIAQKRIDAELQLAASVYRASSEAMFVTDEMNRIVAINPAFTRYTGFESHEVIGRDPGMLGSGRTDKSVYRAMWRALAATGQWQGEIWNRRKNGEEFAEWLSVSTLHDSDGQGLRRIALFSDITEKKRTEELLWQQNNYDSLTELPNRRLFIDRLGQELRRARGRHKPLAVMVIDLDRFKEINDDLGHATGDKLLVEVANRLGGCIRDGDTVARLGGDEFAVMLPSVPDPTVPERIAENMLQILAAPFKVKEDKVYLSGSIGITRYPDDAGEPETLLANAERAMYVAKNSGRNTFAWFTLDLQKGARTRHDLTRDLRQAITREEFEVYYQPIVDTASGTLVKAEALLRWNHPRLGLVSPVDFIPLAEETGMIVPIGDWVFRRVTEHLLLCGASNSLTLQVSINLSPRQFINQQISQRWLEHLSRIGLPPRSIIIELTEGLLLDGSPDVAAHLLRFRDGNIQIAIDDFGTGYSALSYLQKFAVDYLKIDRSFITDLNTDSQDRALADAIVVMAHKLGLKVVAEGVETSEQRDCLLSFGCDYIQGYLFGRPMPAQDFALQLESRKPASSESAMSMGALPTTRPASLH